MWFATLLPGLSLYFNRRKTLGIWLLLLQPTLLGWIIGSFIAVKNLRYRRRRLTNAAPTSAWQGPVDAPGFANQSPA